MGRVLIKQTWESAQSAAGPAAVALPSAQSGHGGLLLAWRGNTNSRNLSVGLTEGPYDAFLQSTLHTTVLSDSSDKAPALLLYQNRLWLAWQGTNAAHTVNTAVVDLGADGSISLSHRAFVNGGSLGNGSTAAPLLVGSPYISWIGLHTRDAAGAAVEAANSPVGTGWQDAQALRFAGNGNGAVADVAFGTDSFLHAWTQNDGRLAFNVSGLEIPFISAETSPFAPSLALFGGAPYVAWTGSDPDHHLNVARVDVTANTVDPIRDKNVVSELSLAAPVLVNVPRGYGNERLAIIWTGVDGAGELNGAVVYEIAIPDPGSGPQ